MHKVSSYPPCNSLAGWEIRIAADSGYDGLLADVDDHISSIAAMIGFFHYNKSLKFNAIASASLLTAK